MCVWLGTLASYHPGLTGRLVREYRTMGELVQRPPCEIVEFASRPVSRRGRRASDGSAGEGGTAAERASDAARFQAVLRAGPADCLRRAERRSPGELVVGWSEALYPDQLRDLGDPPLCLFVRGGADPDTARARLSAIVDAPLVTVVGSRKPSPYGEDMARSIGAGLARAGLVVVSGLALGVDAAAQTAAVDAVVGPEPAEHALRPGPATVAVLGCGADVVYPRRHARLYERIVGSGLVLSEFAWGVPPRHWRFPARNRVMAALGRAVVLVEGAQRSGARITVSHAADLGRDVLCVPGEAGRKLSEAPNRLLDDGARVCESAADVLRVIGHRRPGTGVRRRRRRRAGPGARPRPWGRRGPGRPGRAAGRFADHRRARRALRAARRQGGRRGQRPGGGGPGAARRRREVPPAARELRRREAGRRAPGVET